MKSIKEIKGLIDGIQEMEKAREWGSEPTTESVAAEAAAEWANTPEVKEAVQQYRSIGAAFLDSPEFKALANGAAGANMPAPYQVPEHVEAKSIYSTKDVYSALPSGTPGSFGTIQRDPIIYVDRIWPPPHHSYILLYSLQPPLIRQGHIRARELTFKAHLIRQGGPLMRQGLFMQSFNSARAPF